LLIVGFVTNKLNIRLVEMVGEATPTRIELRVVVGFFIFGSIQVYTLL